MTTLISKFSYLLSFIFFLSFTLSAEVYRAGSDYEVLPQSIRTADSNKIEINEVFHYGCVHCYNFETVMKPWVNNLAADVDFQRHQRYGTQVWSHMQGHILLRAL